jgi:hypothetical protein
LKFHALSHLEKHVNVNGLRSINRPRAQFQERIGKRDKMVQKPAEKFEQATKRLEDVERKLKEKR